jgi:hypothetical protein
VQVKDSFGNTVRRTFSILVTALSAVAISTGSLPAAASGMDYAAVLAGTGGVPPYTWSLDSGALPPGLVLGAVTGQISGTPTAEGTYDFTASITDGASQTASKPLEISVAKDAVNGSPSPQAGDTVIFRDDFESGNLSKWDQAPGRYTIENNPSYVQSGQYAVRGTINAGYNIGQLNKWFLPGYDDVYVKFQVMFSEGFSTSGMHMLALLGNNDADKWSASGKAGIRPTGSDYVYIGVDPESTNQQNAANGLHPFMFYSYWPGMTCPSNYDSVKNQNCWGNVTLQTVPKVENASGVWHNVVFHVKLNDVGQANGMQEMWVDGRRTISQHGMLFRTVEDLHLNQFSWQLYVADSPQIQYAWMDNVVVWTPGTGSTSSIVGSPSVRVQSDGLTPVATNGMLSGTAITEDTSTLAANGDALGQSGSSALTLNISGAGGHPLWSHDFETCTIQRVGTGGVWYDIGYSVVSDVRKGGKAHSGNCSSQAYGGPGRPGMGLLWAPSFGLSDVWLREWIYHSVYWTADPDCVPNDPSTRGACDPHYVRVRDKVDGSTWSAELDGSGRGSGLKMILYTTSGEKSAYVNKWSTQAMRGAWHCWEIHVRPNDLGQSNGLFEMYIDGAATPSGRLTGLDFGPSRGIVRAINFQSNLGGVDAGNWPTSTNWDYVDDVAYGNSRVGCN